MKLKSLNNSRAQNAKKALRENYEVNLQLERMTRKECQSMLTKVKDLILEAKSQPGKTSINNKRYMKMVFLEQALSDHLLFLDRKIPRIIIENKAVDRSEVYLAAEELANSLQAMVEEIGDMLNKELPALVKSIETKIGIKESQTFNQSATATIDALMPAVKQATDAMNSAIDVLTGDEGAAEADAGMELPAPGGTEMPAAAPGAPAPAMGDEVPAEEPEPAEIGAGRALR